MKPWRAVLAPALMLASLVAVGLLAQRLGLDAAIAHAGEHGPLAFVAVATLACAVGVPRQVVAYAGGLAYGFWPAMALASLAEIGGCAIDFWWARLVARRRAARFIARGGRAARIDRFLVANAFSATLTLRLLPFGSNVVLNLVAGISGVAFAPFLAASALGYLPQTVVFALLGQGVRVSASLQVALAAALLALSVALGLILLRRGTRHS